MHPISKTLAILAGISLVAFLFVKATIVAYLAWPLELRGNLIIEPGESAVSVTESLADQFNVPSPKILLTLLKWQGLDRVISAGTISLDGVKNIESLIERLGNPVYDDMEITILEGWTIRDIAAYGKTKGVPALENIASVTGPSAYDFRTGNAQFTQYNTQFDFLKSRPAKATVEGYLFPDTYRIAKDATSDDIAKVLLNTFSTRLTQQMRDDIAKQGKSIHDIVIMASIIEREVRSDADMALVSDLFWRRLELGMPLQADSTVNYAINGDKPSVTLAQTQINSPYNTYKFPGLPLGPIGNPGLRALNAAIYPEKNTFLYFLTDNKGTVYYASTFEGHQQNRAKYLGK